MIGFLLVARKATGEVVEMLDLYQDEDGGFSVRSPRPLWNGAFYWSKPFIGFDQYLQRQGLYLLRVSLNTFNPEAEAEKIRWKRSNGLL